MGNSDFSCECGSGVMCSRGSGFAELQLVCAQGRGFSWDWEDAAGAAASEKEGAERRFSRCGHMLIAHV